MNFSKIEKLIATKDFDDGFLFLETHDKIEIIRLLYEYLNMEDLKVPNFVLKTDSIENMMTIDQYKNYLSMVEFESCLKFTKIKLFTYFKNCLKSCNEPQIDEYKTEFYPNFKTSSFCDDFPKTINLLLKILSKRNLSKTGLKECDTLINLTIIILLIIDSYIEVYKQSKINDDCGKIFFNNLKSNYPKSLFEEVKTKEWVV